MYRTSLIAAMLLVFLAFTSPAIAVEVDLGGFSPLNVQVLEVDGSHLTLAVEIGKFNLKPMKNNDGDRYWRILAPQAGLLPQIGSPELPVVTRLLQLPAESGANLSVVSAKYATVELDAYGGYQLWPNQAPIPKIPGARAAAAFDFNAAAYQLRGFAGPDTALGEPGLLRGMSFASLTVAPFQYDPVSNTLKVATSMIVRVDFTRNAAETGLLSDPAFFTPAFDALADGLFLNHRALQAASDDPTVPLSPVPGGYLIISAPAFVANADLLDLAAWKAEKGYDVTLVSTDVTGTTNEQIRSYILDAYTNWDIPPAYILLVGDTDTIPYFEVDQVSDIYYAAVDGTDYFPDLFYARFPARTADQLANMVYKTLHYELADWDNVADFLTATFMASNDNYSVSEGTHNYVIDTWLTPAGFTSAKRYTHGGATTQQVLDDINAGLNYLIYSGHGSTDSWADGPAVDQSDVEGLTNTTYPFVASHACLTGSYDLDECFAETWVRTDNGGMAFWSASTYTYWDEDDILEKRYFDGIFDPALPRNYYTLGEFTVYGMVKLYEHYTGGGRTQYYFEAYNIMGDASVDLWTGQPTAMSVVYSPVIYFGAISYVVTVSGEEGALVGLSVDGEFVASALTDGGGTATLNWVDPIASPGTYKVTVTKHDRIPFQGDVVATAASSNGMLMASPDVVGDAMDIQIMVSDADLAGNNTMTVDVSSDTEITPEAVTLTEVAPDSGAFAGSITTNSVADIPGNGLIEIDEGDTVTVHYYDADTGSGPEHKYEYIDVDLTAPTFAGATDATGTDLQVVVEWNAAGDPNGPISYQVYRAQTSGGQNFSSPLVETTNLTYTDNDVINNEEFYYVVRATDRFGNQDGNTVEVLGLPVGPNLIWSEDWESPDTVSDWTIINGGTNLKTWTTDDECGQCGSDLFDGVYMMADSDCAGYLPTLQEDLVSPSIDCAGWQDIFLRFANYVNHMGDQYCKLYVSIDQGDWVLLQNWDDDIEEISIVDLSDYADGEDDVRLRFEYFGKYDWWWAIDNLEVLGYDEGPIDDDVVDDDVVDDDVVDDDVVDDDVVDDDIVDDDIVDDDIVDDDVVDDDVVDDDVVDDDVVDDDVVDDDVVDDDVAPDDDIADDDVSDDDISIGDDDIADDDAADDDDDDGCGC